MRGRHRGRLLWRIAALLAALGVMALAVGALVVWLLAALFGLIPAPAPVRILGVVGLGAVAFAVIAGLRGMRRLALPVGDLVEAAGRIEAGDYSVRVAERGPREVRSVVRAFNSMGARLEATDSQRRSFVADVSHELRTPLSIIRGQAEGIVDGIYPGDAEHLAPILDATETLELLVEDIRTLALSETGSLALAREPVDLAVLVNETLAAFRAPAAAKGVTLAEDVSRDVPAVDADPARIRGVLGNLLTNAIRHTPAGGSVTVGAAGAGGLVTISVRDTGEGIPLELKPRVFERFVKSADSRGSGLGLAIARDVVVAHGGQIELGSLPGAGTEVRFTLPLA